MLTKSRLFPLFSPKSDHFVADLLDYPNSQSISNPQSPFPIPQYRFTIKKSYIYKALFFVTAFKRLYFKL
ncbi:hypothetical protein BC008_40955 [Mastigocoleus testarum BC008]|uniref:Uncharacterized protein n=1 Tax=Mastigocoleus testarum BC008 TaxID=371196 RepID=A0A0V7ZJG2_9CYAN|nr:hypothetical protein BC008_39980 [Mastigocoleus testarum BC008]KST64691.1 hypothetical protein BC008_40955 [Mastigocoleus testarum BC008]